MLPSDSPFIPSVKTLETELLSIRIDPEAAYLEAFRTKSDEELKTYFGIATDETLQAQKAKISGGLTTYRTALVFFHLIERANDVVIGSIAFHNWFPSHRRCEIGYAIGAEEYNGQGFMREAMRPIIEFGFGEMELNRIEAFIHPQNAASIKLVERVGFRQEGWLHEHHCGDGVLGDSLVFGLLKSAYSGPRTQ